MKFDAPRINSYSSGETTTFTIGETAMKPRFLTRMLSIMFMLTFFAWTSSATAGSGGTITWGKPTEVISFDPHYSGDGASWTFFYLIYDQLLSTDDDLGLVPGLAGAGKYRTTGWSTLSTCARGRRSRTAGRFRPMTWSA